MSNWDEALEITQGNDPWKEALSVLDGEAPKQTDQTPSILAEARTRALSPVVSGQKVDPYSEYLDVAGKYGIKHGDNPKLQESWMDEYSKWSKHRDIAALGKTVGTDFYSAGRLLAGLKTAEEQGVFLESLQESWTKPVGSDYSPQGGGASILPFIGAIDKGIESYNLLDAINAIEADQKGTSKLSDAEREKNLGLVYGYLLHQQALQKVGASIGTDVLIGAMQMPAFMLEFLASGGLASGAKTAAQKGIARLLGDGILSRLTQKGAGWIASGAARAATALQPRVIGGTIERMTPTTGIQVSDDPNERLAISEQRNGILRAYSESFADQTIEAMSEESGEALTKVLTKVVTNVPGVNRLYKMWENVTGGEKTEFIKRLFKASGYNGTLEEMGEERIGGVLRAIAGVDAGDKSFKERLAEALKPGWEQLGKEALLFSIPGAAQMGAASMHNRMQMRSDIKQAQGEGLQGSRMVDWIVNAKPDGIASVIDFASQEKPSRSAAAKAGIKEHTGAEERQQTAEVVRESLAEMPPEVVQAAKEGDPAAAEQVKEGLIEWIQAKEVQPSPSQDIGAKVSSLGEYGVEATPASSTTEEQATAKPKLSFEEFEKEYTQAFQKMVEYGPDKVGSQVYMEKMAALSEAYPGWAEKVEEAAKPKSVEPPKPVESPKPKITWKKPKEVKAAPVDKATSEEVVYNGSIKVGVSQELPGKKGTTFVVQKRKPDAIPDTHKAIITKTEGGFLSVSATGMSAEEAYEKALRDFEEKESNRGTETTQAGRHGADSGNGPEVAEGGTAEASGRASNETSRLGEVSRQQDAKRDGGTGKRKRTGRVRNTGNDATGQPGATAPAESVGKTEGEGTGESAGRPSGEESNTPAVEEEKPREEPKPEENPEPKEPDHKITTEDVIAPRGKVTRLKSNIAAIKLLRKLESENRPAVADEKKVLAAYVGWGGLSQALDKIKGEYMLQGNTWGRDENWEAEWGKYYRELKDILTPEEFASAQASTRNAHYTDRKVIEAMWKMAQRLGFVKGTVLEPAAGIGHVLGLMPEGIKAKRVAVELDSLSGRMLQKLYPNSTVFNKGLEETPIPPNSVDLCITNVPFDRYGPLDAEKRYGMSMNLHNYFIARILDSLKPGGVGIIITSHHTADSAKAQRDILAQRGELLAAIRLPNTAQAESANTEVTTDILLLRKPDGRNVGAETWREVSEIETIDNVPAYVNEYFARHPEQMLGKPSMAGSMYAHASEGEKREFTLLPDANRPMEKDLEEAIGRLPEGILNVKASNQDFDFKAADEAANMKERSLVERPDGSLAVVEDGKFVDPSKFGLDMSNKKTLEMAKGFVRLRDAYQKHLDLMRSDATDDEVKESAAVLETIYKEFRNKYATDDKGLSGRKMGIFQFDNNGLPLVQSLEKVTRKLIDGRYKDVTTPADVFRVRTQRKIAPPSSVESVQDAIRVSLAFRGRLDIDYMTELTGKKKEDVTKELTENGAAFENPETGMWETSEEYLSGFVRDKLRSARAAAEADAKYKTNVDALEKVQPTPKAYSKIGARLGSAWVPDSVIQDFIREALDDRYAKVRYNKQLDTWDADTANKSNVKNQQTFGGGGRTAIAILEKLLNNKVIEVFSVEEYTDEDGNTKERKILDQKATTAAQMAADKLQAEFTRWVKSREDIQIKLQDEYNEQFNGYVRPKWDGSHLMLPGANSEVRFRDYQKNAIWRMIQQGYGLLAHAVGAGKTYTSIALAMELRRLGLANKPMIVVQNATLGQFATSFKSLYPTAKLLVAQKEDLSAERRNLFMARIASGDYDAVVVAQSSFDLLPNDPKREEEFLNAQIQELEEAIAEESGKEDSGYRRSRQKSPTVKELEAAKKALIKRIEKIQASMKERADNTVFFEQLGVDTIIVDEAHAYKKPYFMTKMNKIGGITRQTSSKAYNLQMKAMHIQEKRQGRGVFLMTGTPVTNTLGESWLLTKIISPKLLKKFNVDTFDRFASTFAQVRSETEMNAGGKWVRKNMLSRFGNKNELLNMILSSWDVITLEQLHQKLKDAGVGIPKLIGGKMQTQVVDKSPAVTSFNKFLTQVYEKYGKLRGKEKKEYSYIPVLTYMAARAAALDIRLVYPTAKEDEGSKVNKLVENALKIYEDSKDNKGTQLIFSDIMNPVKMDKIAAFMSGEEVRFDIDEEEDEDEKGDRFLYDQIKKKLIAGGVPANEIAVIHDYPTDQKRTALFERVNAGDVRFLIGSSSKMGVGVNVQTKAVALHHLDCPWLPADLEQREGRILRQGNENVEVSIMSYGMKDTLDAAIWQKITRKAKFIRQLLAGQVQEEEFDDPAGAVVLSAEEQMALLAGDPRVMQKIELEQEIRQMRWEADAFEDTKAAQRESKAKKEEMLRDKESRVDIAKKEIDDFNPDAPIVLNGKTLDKKDAAKLIDSLIEEKTEDAKKNRDGITIVTGKAFGMDLKVILTARQVVKERTEKGMKLDWEKKVDLYVSGKSGKNNYNGNAATGAGIIQAIAETDKRILSGIEEANSLIAKWEKDIKEISELLKQTWDRSDELAEKEGKLREIDAGLTADEKAGNKDAPKQEEEQEEDIPYQVKYNEEWTPVEDATPLDIDGYPGLYIHKSAGEKKRWTVSEVSTGLAVVSGAYTREDAIESTKKRLPSPEKFKEVIDKSRENGLSPFYEQEKKRGNINYSLKPAEAGKITEESVKRTFPGAKVDALPEWSGWRVTFKSGYYVDIRWVDQVAIDWEAAEKQYGQKFTAAQRKSIAAAGTFELRTKDGREISGIGLMQLHNGLADDATLRHESVHLADRMGFFTAEEWQSLVKQHSNAAKDRDGQAEDIARAREAWIGPGSLTKKLGGWFRGIMEDFGLIDKELTAEEVHKRMDTAEFWARGPVKIDSNGRKTVDLYFGNPDLANPARDEGVRRQIDRIDEKRKQQGLPAVKHLEQARKEAEELMKHPSKVKAKLLSRAADGIPLTYAETIAAKELLNREGLKALKSGDAEKLAEFGRLVEAYRDTGTAEAQSFRARFDPVEKPAQRRQRALMEALLTPPQAQYRLIQQAREKGNHTQADAMHKEWAQKAYQLSNQLRVMGHDVTDPSTFENPQKAAEVLGVIQAGKADWGDKAYEYWRNAILSAPTTQAANIVGNTTFGVWKNLAERFVEASVNVVMQQEDAAQFGEFKYLLRGMMPTIGQGFKNALRAFRSETPYFETEVLQSINPSTKMETPNVAIEGTKGRIVRLPQRGLVAADEFFKTIYTTAEAGAQAYRIAKSEGLEGEALEKRVEELLADKGSLAWIRGLEEAKTALFQEEGGRFMRGILNMRNAEVMGLKPFRWLVPFVVTPANIFRHGIRRTPLGSVALAKETYDAIKTGDYSKVPPRVAEQVIAWGVFMALVSAVAGGGDDDPWITGAAAEGSGDRQQQYRLNPPQSIKIFGKWYSYSRIEPFATTIALVVDAIQAGNRPGDWSQKAKKAFSGLTEQVKNKTFLSGIADLLEAIEGQRADVLPQWASNFVTSWVPNVFKAAGRASDELVRERGVWGEGDAWTTRMLQRTLAKTELGLSDVDFPKYDLFGREINRWGPRTNWLMRMVVPWQVREVDPKRADLMLKNWNLQNPENTYYPVAPSHGWTKDGQKVELNEVEYAEYCKAAGRLADKAASLFGWQPNKPTQAQVDRLQEVVNASRKYTRDHFRGNVDVDAAAEEIKADLIAKWGQKISRPRPVKKADLADWEKDVSEAKDWLKDVDKAEAAKAYRSYLAKEIKTPDIRAQRLQAFLKRLSH